MLRGKLLALLLGLFFLVLLVRSLRAALHSQRSFDEFSPRAAERLRSGT